jgi:hypothetical protein
MVSRGSGSAGAWDRPWLIFGTGGYAADKIRKQYACTGNNI